jgi:hypothetical protein
MARTRLRNPESAPLCCIHAVPKNDLWSSGLSSTSHGSENALFMHGPHAWRTPTRPGCCAAGRRHWLYKLCLGVGPFRHDFISDNIHRLYCTRPPLADLMGAMNGACCLSLSYALFLSLSTLGALSRCLERRCYPCAPLTDPVWVPETCSTASAACSRIR